MKLSVFLIVTNGPPEEGGDGSPKMRENNSPKVNNIFCYNQYNA